MTTAVVPGRQPPQLDELEAQRLEVGDVAVQGGPVGHGTNQQGVGAGRDGLERLQRRRQRGWDPARDPESVVSSVHVGLLASSLMVGGPG
jgi:hypothetical protein